MLKVTSETNGTRALDQESKTQNCTLLSSTADLLSYHVHLFSPCTSRERKCLVPLQYAHVWLCEGPGLPDLVSDVLGIPPAVLHDVCGKQRCAAIDTVPAVTHDPAASLPGLFYELDGAVELVETEIIAELDVGHTQVLEASERAAPGLWRPVDDVGDASVPQARLVHGGADGANVKEVELGDLDGNGIGAEQLHGFERPVEAIV